VAVEQSSKSAARARWIIVLALAGLGLYLFMRYRKQQAAAAAPASAASQGSTDPNQMTVPYVPQVNLSGTYNGPYTPYNVITNGVQQPSGSMPGGQLTDALTNALTNGAPVSVVNNSNKAG
jgi:hypothetical protein